MELWELAARESIRDTVATYAHCADRGRFDELVALFAPDGVLEVHGETRRVGRDAIRTFLGGVKGDVAAAAGDVAPHIRHHVTNLRIDVASPTEAHGASYFLVVTQAGVDHWGRYRDTYVPEHGTPGDGRWLFAHRYVRTDGSVPASFTRTRRSAGTST